MNIFNQSAGAYDDGLQGMDAGQQTWYGGNYGNGLQGANRGAGNPTDYASQGAGMLGNNKYGSKAANLYGQTSGRPIVRQTMNQYLNPYQDQVVNSTVDTMRDERNNQLNDVRAQAAQSGAFGGARQGLVEQGVYDRSQENIGNAVGALNQQGFSEAAQLGQSRISQMQQSGQGYAGLGQQQAQAGQSLAGIGQQQQQMGMQGENSYNQFQMQRNNLDMQNRQMGMQAAQGQLGAAQQGFNMGNTLNQNQMQAGGQQQQLNQQVLNQGNDQYSQYSNQPSNSLQMLLAGLTGNPLGGNTTTTNTSTPGLFDYLSTGAGMVGTGMSGGWF
tara:strand:+ start:13139 stop:14125 length:987 start_codon:yes stop_codon:yes gene_type:complete